MAFSTHFPAPLGEHQLAQPRLGSEVEEWLIADVQCWLVWNMNFIFHNIWDNPID
jgi:hypothetical protein